MFIFENWSQLRCSAALTGILLLFEESNCLNILRQAVQEECENITILQNVSKYISTDTGHIPEGFRFY